MRKFNLLASAAISVLALGMAAPVHAVTTGVPKDQVPVYRLYNKNTGEHFYTPNAEELIHLQGVGWTSEGIGWYAPATGDPVYRIYNPNAKGGDHYYTLDKSEAENDVSVGWKWDNDGKPAFYSAGEIETYVAYNPNATSGAHNYTTNWFEQNNLLYGGWTYGATAWKALKEGNDEVNPAQIKNHDTSTIQGLWRNDEGKTLEIIGDQLILDGDNLTTYRQYRDNDNYVMKSIWDSVYGGNTSVTFSIETTGGFAIVISPAWTVMGPNDRSDSSKARIAIGQEAVSSTTHAFYRV